MELVQHRRMISLYEANAFGRHHLAIILICGRRCSHSWMTYFQHCSKLYQIPRMKWVHSHWPLHVCPSCINDIIDFHICTLRVFSLCRLELSINSMRLLVGSWVLCIQRLPRLVNFLVHVRRSVEVWMKNILYESAEGETHFGIWCVALKSLASFNRNRLLFIVIQTLSLSMHHKWK